MANEDLYLVVMTILKSGFFTALGIGEMILVITCSLTQTLNNEVLLCELL